jgi:hypothetical protein
MTIQCNHPRPALNLPGYTPPRYSWKPPAVFPTDPAGMSRALLEAFRGIGTILQQLGQRRTIVPLLEDIDAREGQIIVGVADGQVIRLPELAPGELGQVGIVLTDVTTPITLVHPDGSTTSLGTPGAYDFTGGSGDATYQTNPGGTVLSGAVPTDRLLGRDSTGTGAFETISVTGGLEFTGSQSIRVADLGISTAKLAASAVTNAKLANMAAGRIKGVQVDGATGDPQDLTGSEVGELARHDTVDVDTTSSGTVVTYPITSTTTQVAFKIASALTIHGLTSTSATFGKTVQFSMHAGFAGSVTFKNESGSAAAALNRISCPGNVDFVLNPGEVCIATMFDSRWRIVGISKTVARRFPCAPIYDVMDAPFNAAGNGTTDDTAAINAAIAAANLVPGAVYLGSRHRITGALTALANNDIALIGRGEFNGGTIISLDVGSTLGTAAISVTGQYCMLQGFWLVTTYASATSKGIHLNAYRPTVDSVVVAGWGEGIEIDRCNTAHLTNCQIGDVLGAYGYHVHGTNPDFCHVTQFSRCLVGQNYPLALGAGRGAWATSTAYALGDIVRANGSLWQCSTAGTSSGAGSGPSGLPSTNPSLVHVTPVVDGTAQWRFAMGAFAGFAHGSFAHTVMYDRCGCLQGNIAMHVFDDQGDAATFIHTWQFSSDHTFERGILIEACDGAVWLDQTLVTSVLSTTGVGVELQADAHGWQFSGGQIYGMGREGVIISGHGGKLHNLEVARASSASANTYDAIRIDAGVLDIVIQGCTAGNVFGGSSSARYGISVGAGADNYVIEGNILIGNDTGGILNTPGVSSTRVVRNNLPDYAFDLTDGDKGDIVVSGSGTIWTWEGITILANGAGPVKWTAFDFNDSSTIDWAFADDGGGQLNIVLTVIDDSITNAKLAEMAANTIKANATAGTANPTDLAIAADSFPARVGGNLVSHPFATLAGTALTYSAGAINWDGITVLANGAGPLAWTSFDFDDTTSIDFVFANNGLGQLNISAQRAALTGDVTAAANSNATTIANDAVSDAKLRDSAALSVIGRASNTSGDPADITANAVSNAGHALKLNNAGTALSFGTIDTPGLAGGSVTDTILRDSAALSVIGRSANSSGDPADIAAGTDGHVLRRSGTTLGFGTVANAGLRDSAALSVIGRSAGTSGVVADITANSVTNAGHALKVANDGSSVTFGTLANQGLANMSQSRVKGRAEGAGTGDPQDLTPTEVMAIIDGESVAWTGIHTFGGSYTQFTSPQSWGNIASANLAATQNNFSAPNANICRFTLTGDQQLTGVDPGSAAGNRLMLIVNADDTDTLTLAHEGATSTAANRFLLPGSTTRALLPHACALMMYDQTSSRWRMAYPL